MASEKNVGVSAGFLALVAFLMHSFVPPPSEQKSGDSTRTTGEAHGGSSTNAEKPKPVPELGPWLASRQFFHQEPRTDFKSTCLDYLIPPLGEKGVCTGAAVKKLFGMSADFYTSNLHTLIATIPDPLHTRMSLNTDRALDAIQQGAFAAEWELATQWLPWSIEEGQRVNQHTSSTASAFDLERLPGLIVFRRRFLKPSEAGKVLFVFIVGETPTAGINGFQFEAARRSIQALLHPDRISVLGPCFSGSFLSLTGLIQGDTTKTGYDIRSGSVRNSYYASSMMELVGGSHNVTFKGYTIPSSAFDKLFVKIATDEGFGLEETAALVEDESGFSVGITQGNKGDTALNIYRYPRDIAQLRDAYSDVAFSSQQKPGSTAPPAIQLSLKDTQSGESDFPVFSTSHTPVSQDAILGQIVRDLRRKRVRLLSLSATNVFDELFLANVLTKECPDLRLVLSGADLLFVQQASQNSLTGILAISAFPMFAKGFEWSNNGRHQDTTFADTDSIGVYNATMASVGGNEDSYSVALAPPVENRNEPLFFSPWLLVLGTRGWMPVDLLGVPNPKLSPDSKQEWFADGSKPKAKANELAKLAKNVTSAAPRNWTIVCLVSAALSLAFFGHWLYLFLRPNARSSSALCSIELMGKEELSRLSMARFICLSGCFCTLFFGNGVLWLAMSSDVARPSVYLSVLAGSLAPFTAGLILLYGTFRHRRNAHSQQSVPKRYRYTVLLLQFGLLSLACAGLYLWHGACFDQSASSIFFRFRVLSLSFPISPVWPLLLGTSGLFAIAFFHLRRLTWAHWQKPELDTKTLDMALWGQLEKAEDTLDRIFSGPARTEPKTLIATLATITALVILLFMLFPMDSLRSFEKPLYKGIVVALYFPLTMLAADSFIRFAGSWNILRHLLSTLNSLDIGRFFAKFSDFEGSGPIWVRDLKLMSFATSVNSEIALHNLQLTRPATLVDPKNYWQKLKHYLSPQAARDRNVIREEYKTFVNTARSISATLSATVLMPYWEKNKLPFVQIERGKEAAETSPPLTAAASTTGSVSTQGDRVDSESYEMASNYVALQYSIFIGYALRHIQNLLLCSVLTFVMMVLGLNSFSFQAPQAISHLTITALALGAMVVVRVLAEIERNPIISRISGNREGSLGKDFYMRVITYGALPVLTVLGTQFPSIGRFLTSWAEPALESLR
jgi:hypothetical protein